MAESYHKTLRGLVKDALGEALTAAGIPLRVSEGAVYDPAKFDKPCAAVTYAGGETAEWATSHRDDVNYPLLVGLYTSGPDTDPPGCELTLFREVVRGAFHHRRLAGAADVLWCLVTPFTPPVQADESLFQGLRSALVVTPVARRLRGG